MSPAVEDPDRQLLACRRATGEIRDNIARVVGTTSPSHEWDLIQVDTCSCSAKKEAAHKYKGGSSQTRIDEVDSEEDAVEYLSELKRRYEEGKTTRLP